MEVTPKVEQRRDEGGFSFRRTRTKGSVHFFSTSTPGFAWLLLVLFLCLVYVPFLGSRVVRPAGDDKVYVSQAVEMARNGAWFLQTLAGEPNYYKGPLHYILLRFGMLVFGFNMWATVWMNFVLVVLGSVSIGSLVHRRMREFGGWGFFAGMAFGVNAGIYSHVFASQMEVETACMMAIGLNFLDRSGPERGAWRFWLIAGLLGWLKSPLHSVMLGVTALFFWIWNRELLSRARNPQAWLAALFGVSACALGYAPAYFLDRVNFWNAYVLRETFWNPANGAPWHYPVIPFFTYFLLPWTLPAFVAYLDGLTRPLRRRQRPIRSTEGSRRIVALGAFLVLPSLLFFLYHPYRGQNYNLPVLGGLILIVTSLWASRAPTWDLVYQIALGLTALILIAVVSGVTIVTRHFDPMPGWWSSWRLPVLWLGFFVTARGLWREGVTFRMMRPDSLARRTVWVFVAIGGFISLLGEREMIDVRVYLAFLENKLGRHVNVSYYNLPKHPESCCTNIWSEWGYLNFMIPYPVQGLFNNEQLETAAARGDLILVPGDEFLADMNAKLSARFPPARWSIETWKRWKTKGKNAQGVPAWQEAWDTRDLTKLEKNFYMVKIRP